MAETLRIFRPFKSIAVIHFAFFALSLQTEFFRS